MGISFAPWTIGHEKIRLQNEGGDRKEAGLNMIIYDHGRHVYDMAPFYVVELSLAKQVDMRLWLLHTGFSCERCSNLLDILAPSDFGGAGD